jgi:hypothetical protein
LLYMWARGGAAGQRARAPRRVWLNPVSESLRRVGRALAPKPLRQRVPAPFAAALSDRPAQSETPQSECIFNSMLNGVLRAALAPAAWSRRAEFPFTHPYSTPTRALAPGELWLSG